MEISQHHEELIKRKVASGRYGSPDEVLEKALQALDERGQALAEELADIEAKLDIADEQIEKGELIPASEVFDELRQRNDYKGLSFPLPRESLHYLMSPPSLGVKSLRRHQPVLPLGKGELEGVRHLP